MKEGIKPNAMFRVNFAEGETEALKDVQYLYQLGTGMGSSEDGWDEPDWEADPTLGIVSLIEDVTDEEAALAFTSPENLCEFLRQMQSHGHLHFVTTAMRIPVREMKEEAYGFDVYVDPSSQDFLDLLQGYRVLDPSAPRALAQRGRPKKRPKKQRDAVGTPDRQQMYVLYWTRTVAEWSDEKKRLVLERLEQLAKKPAFDPDVMERRYTLDGLEKRYSGRSLVGLRRILVAYLEAKD